MRARAFFVFLVITISGIIAVTKGGDDVRIAEQLQEVVEKSILALENEDLEASMDTIHPMAPIYQKTKQFTSALFAALDLKSELVEMRLIGLDGEYALARVRQKTIKIRGTEYRNNVSDVVHIFRKQDETWKFWQMAVLDVEYLLESDSRDQAGIPVSLSLGGR